MKQTLTFKVRIPFNEPQNVYVHKSRHLCRKVYRKSHEKLWSSLYFNISRSFFHLYPCFSMAISPAQLPWCSYCQWRTLIQRTHWHYLAHADLNSLLDSSCHVKTPQIISVSGSSNSWESVISSLNGFIKTHFPLMIF